MIGGGGAQCVKINTELNLITFSIVFTNKNKGALCAPPIITKVNRGVHRVVRQSYCPYLDQKS